ncbi:hypothetical protein GUITHDRAFT_107925 [Guillardia theta CCMP2712]|uniref:Uncharacterized protein n=1 Tax=Guillardia theta (strain CCMP2712) TaxID=905079 RepID=L1JCU1_GUITC|nr:hypothetical protein GUITHDRAFT_107925 [Guillardia theta CCMP2712]EKX46316.1 hypothetical protein GUITHDRAFT_107925 [Guillardia theta CCMP2712]|eukprot:XP_005833296.1 hypothetical protein GUITHDRAFT_107925 [Guillardia theta CCMP2712]
MKNPRIKEFLRRELRSDEDLQYALRYITKLFLADEVEGSIGLTVSNVALKKYVAIMKLSPRTSTHCATPVRKICRTRVTMTNNLHEELEVFCTEEGAHGASLRRTIEKVIDRLNLGKYDKLIVTVNSDCTKLTKCSSSDKKHTEITISILPYHTKQNSAEWISVHETRMRFAPRLVTLMIIPDKDSGENLERNFWHYYTEEIQDLQTEGVHIHDGKAMYGADKSKAGGNASNKIGIEFLFRADLAGHYAYLQRGGPHDSDGEFCIHCKEKLHSKKSAKFFAVHTVSAEERFTWDGICNEYQVVPKDMRDLNLL